MKRQPLLTVTAATIAVLTGTHQGAVHAEQSLAAVYTMSNASSGKAFWHFIARRTAR